MKQLVTLFLVTIFLHAAPVDNAKELFNNNKYAEAIKIFKTIENNPEVQYYLGKAYLYGLGFEKDFEKASFYAKKSAEKDFPAGLNLLGVLYANGEGVAKDEIEALLYYKQAAKLGNTLAMNNIGRSYQQGFGVSQNFDKAFEWFRKAIDANDSMGHYYMADTYFYKLQEYENAIKYYLEFLKHASNIPNDVYAYLGECYRKTGQYKKAYTYYKKAAELDNVIAMFGLYLVIDKHPEVTQISDEGLDWLKKAAEHNNKDAVTFLYSQYMFKLKDYVKAKELAEKAYANGNADMGCALASQYSNIIFKWHDLKKAYDIANSIIQSNKPSSELNTCFIALATLYRKGEGGVAQNIPKAIRILEEQYDKTLGVKLQLSVTIASIYLEELQDYKNAEKWYKITYEETKDSDYLTKVDEYKAKLPHFTVESKKDEKLEVFPIIDSFNNEHQVTAVLESKQYYFLATAQKSINIYDKKTLKLVRELRGHIGKSSDGKILQMAYDENKNLLYCSGLNSETDMVQNEIIKVFDANTGKVVRTVKSPKATTITYLDVSSDGKYLATIGRGVLLNIIDLDTNKTQSYDYYSMTKLRALMFSKTSDDCIVKALGADNFLYSISVNKKKQIDKAPFSNQITFKEFNKEHAKKIFQRSNKNKIEKLTIKDNNLFLKIGNIKKFSFEELKFSEYKDKVDFNNNESTNIGVKRINNDRTIQIYNKNKLLTSLEFLSLQPVAYRVIKDQYIVVSIYESNIMLVFNFEGRPIAQLAGAQSIQINLVYKDQYLVTNGNDNIVHLWDLDNLSEIERKKSVYDPEILKTMNRTFGGNALEMLNDKEFMEKGGETVTKQFAAAEQLPFIPTVEQFLTMMKMILLKKEEINPLASFYIKNNDWIVYNDKGIFASSENGKNLIRYHLNQGINKEAKIIENDQLFDKFYRPDIMRKLLTKEDVDTDIDIRSIILNIKPPSVAIVNHVLEEKKNLKLTYKVCDAGSGISNISLIINDMEKSLQNSRGFIVKNIKAVENRCKLLQDIITLEPGKNYVALQAFDKEKIISNRSEKIVVDANYTIVKKPQLFFVSMAVSDYKEESLKLKYPVKDVLAVEADIKAKSKNIFSKINTFSLLDKEVTKENLNNLFEKISQNIEMNDVFILYLAGHGVTNDKDGLFYFLPYNMKNTGSKDLEKDAISVNEIKSQLSKINTSKFLILIDTCNSGSFIDNTNISDETLHRLSYGSKRNYIVASSETQVALEGYKGHGIFTYTVLDAFDKAYFPDDTFLSVAALADYVEKNVPKITKKLFHYEQTPQTSLSGEKFPIVEKQEK